MCSSPSSFWGVYVLEALSREKLLAKEVSRASPRPVTECAFCVTIEGISVVCQGK